MSRYYFASDLHGNRQRYETLFSRILNHPPDVLLLGGDLMPNSLAGFTGKNGEKLDFMDDFLIPGFTHLREALGQRYPKVCLILGNDDSWLDEEGLEHGVHEGLWDYLNKKGADLGIHRIFGYNYIPPSPFLWKDFEKYDVSRYVDPGCIAPEEGKHSYPVNKRLLAMETIQADLKQFIPEGPLDDTLLLFHCPPYQSLLDRAALDGRLFDHVPLDVHIGSIAIRRFIESRQPKIGLHGHVHESTRLTGSWQDRIGKTLLFNAAHDGPELSLIEFDPENPEKAIRHLL